MKIAIHIGAHCTNGAPLLRAVLKNKQVLAEHSVAVPQPSRYRGVLPDVMKQITSNPASHETQELLLDQLMDMDHPDRVVLSYEDVICTPTYVFAKNQLYGKADFKLPWLRNVFADHPMEFYLGLRNPASFIPELFAMTGDKTTYNDFIGATDVMSLRWSSLVRTIRNQCPDVELTCFAYEDTPLTWAQILHEFAGVAPTVPLAGGLDIVASIITDEGFTQLRSYLETHPVQSEGQKREILLAFLDKYLNEEAVDTEIDLPGWDADLVGRLTAQYDADLETIAAMDSVRLIRA